MAGDRTHIDDLATPLQGFKLFGFRLNAPQRTLYIDQEDPLNLILRNVENGATCAIPASLTMISKPPSYLIA